MTFGLKLGGGAWGRRKEDTNTTQPSVVESLWICGLAARGEMSGEGAGRRGRENRGLRLSKRPTAVFNLFTAGQSAL